MDRIYQAGRWELSRRFTAIIGFVMAAGGLIGSIHMETPTGAILFLSIAIFGADMTLSPSWSLCIDIGGSHSGAVSGTMNMAGNLGSFVTALAFPYLQSWTGSEEPFFYAGATLSVVAIGLWCFIRPERPLEEY